MTTLLDALHEITIIVWKNELHPFECSILKLNLIFFAEQTFIFTIILLTSLWTSLELYIA